MRELKEENERQAELIAKLVKGLPEVKLSLDDFQGMFPTPIPQ